MRGRKIREISEAFGNAVLTHMVFLLPQSKEEDGERVVKTHETLLSLESSHTVLSKKRHTSCCCSYYY